MKKSLISKSKFLSLVLRHTPDAIGIRLDPEGWISVDKLLSACQSKGRPISSEELVEIVETNEKKRFIIRDGKIRANQGHSIEVDLHLAPIAPPELLYHSTADRFVPGILNDGLMKMNRQNVHLSSDKETAISVGARHGRPVILCIKARQMYAAGLVFYLSENKVWLTDAVPARFISIDESE